MPSRSASSSANPWWVASIVGASVVYAVLRYNVFAGVAWAELPLYVSNKGISLASIVLLAVAYLAGRLMPWDREGREQGRPLARTAGLAGFGLALIHVLMSFEILTPAHYPRLFTAAELNRDGWICLASGAFATALFTLPAIYSVPRFVRFLGPANWKRAQQLGYLGLGLTALHVVVIGSANWMAVSRWPGGMPPISLISFLACAAPIVAKLRSAYSTGDRSKSLRARAIDEGQGRRVSISREP